MRDLRKQYREERGILEPKNVMALIPTHQEDKDYIEWLESKVPTKDGWRIDLKDLDRKLDEALKRDFPADEPVCPLCGSEEVSEVWKDSRFVHCRCQDCSHIFL